MAEAAWRLYEHEAVRRVAGDAIRPGGLALTRRALALAALPPGARLLDLGCGVGATVALCRAEFELDALGLDLSPVLLAEGRAQAAGRPLLQATALEVPFPAGVFDAVLAECSLSLLADWERALAEVRRVLRPGGLFVASDVYAAAPQGASSPPSIPVRCCLGGARSRHEFEAQLTARGFALLHWEDHSAALTQFAARLIWEHGSLAAFWACAGAAGHEVPASPGRPGYFLALAQNLSTDQEAIWTT